LKFASIDIGSNAIRLLFCNVIEQQGKDPIFKKNSLIRIPLRLGEDSFSKKEISADKVNKLVKTMQAFKKLIEVHEVLAYKACATSAMREARNGSEIIKKVKEESGIDIEIIDGKTEAEIIYSNHIERLLNDKQPYLYIDVGGGSTELTLFHKGKFLDSHSFNIGTIRLLQNQIVKADWDEMKDWIKSATYSCNSILGIGSGGNINKIVNMVKKKDYRNINFDKLHDFYKYIKTVNYEDRIRILGLNPDRADVIEPAAEIFLFVMKTARIEKIYVPQIGMSDGIVHLLYETYKAKDLKPVKT